MTLDKLKNILEAVLLAADKPMSVQQLDAIFEGDEDHPTRDDIRKALHELTDEYADRGFELRQIASGFRIQVKQDFADWVGRLWEEKPARYTRALLETMSLIAYRQPITRGELKKFVALVLAPILFVLYRNVSGSKCWVIKTYRVNLLCMEQAGGFWITSI